MKQSEKEDVKKAILNDQIFTTVCEPGWEFNLDPVKQHIMSKFSIVMEHIHVLWII